MSCILRYIGDQIDIKMLLTQTSLPIHSFWQKGTPRTPGIPNSKVHASSGLRILVSNAEFEEFHQQVQDATTFLQKHRDALMLLIKFPSVTEAELDFGVTTTSSDWKTYRFPLPLTTLAASLNIALSLSTYPTETSV